MPITFDSKSARYRESSGRFISDAQVRSAAEKVVAEIEKDLSKIARNFNAGNINLPELQIRLGEQIKTGHVLTSAIGYGGRRSMTVADWGTVGADIREQYRFLNRFALDIEAGKVSATRIEQRARLYARSIRTAFYKAEMKAKTKAGFSHCRRRLYAVESCFECLLWATKGFIPIEEQPPIGTLACKSFCKCELEYKRSG